MSPHMDFVYYESPPGLQFLLCRRNDEVVEGGESILIDAFEVAHHLKKHFPEEFETLSTVPVKFQKIHFEIQFILNGSSLILFWIQTEIFQESTGRPYLKEKATTAR